MSIAQQSKTRHSLWGHVTIARKYYWTQIELVCKVTNCHMSNKFPLKVSECRYSIFGRAPCSWRLWMAMRMKDRICTRVEELDLNDVWCMDVYVCKGNATFYQSEPITIWHLSQCLALQRLLSFEYTWITHVIALRNHHLQSFISHLIHAFMNPFNNHHTEHS